MAQPLRKPFLFCALVLLCQMAFSQTFTPKHVAIGRFSNGYYEYLPQGYNAADAKTYPLIFFIHGAGDVGDGSPQELPRLLRVGLTREISIGGFPSSFTVNGEVFRFIVIAPQYLYMPEARDAVPDISVMLNYVLQNYKVDRTRIYMTGLSKGGGLTFDFAGYSAANAAFLAAIVPSAQATLPVRAQARTIAAGNLPVWATHNQLDQDAPVSNTENYIDWINEAPAPNPLAKKTIFPGPGHDSWTQTYNPQFKENGMNVYEWMLQYKRPVVVPPSPPSTDTESLNLWPSPATDVINVELKGKLRGSFKCTLYSMTGIPLKEWAFNKQADMVREPLNITELPNAAYILSVSMDGYKAVRKLVKSKHL